MNFGSVHSQESLIGGDDVLAASDGRQYQISCGFITADQLDDDIDVRVFDDLQRIGCQHCSRKCDSAVTSDVPHCNLCHVDRDTTASPYQFRILPEDSERTAPDSPETDDADIDTLLHSGCSTLSGV